jgi:hypothetical protein
MLYEIKLPHNFERLNSVLDQPVKVGALDFLIAVYGRYGSSGPMTQRVFRWTFGSDAPAIEVPLARYTTARGVLFVGDSGVWLVGFEDEAGNRDRLYMQLVEGFTPYREPQGLAVADVRGVVLEALRGLLFDVEAVRKLLRW